MTEFAILFCIKQFFRKTMSRKRLFFFYECLVRREKNTQDWAVLLSFAIINTVLNLKCTKQTIHERNSRRFRASVFNLTPIYFVN